MSDKYKNVTIQGSRFPDAPYSSDVKISFTKEMMDEYIPTIAEVMKDSPKGFRLLLIIMANKEGFKKGSRSYRNNNPGNIGNTDAGVNRMYKTLAEGILAQKTYVEKIIAGNSKTYPMNTIVNIRPFYSAEIAENQATYKMSPYLPGYRFIFNGQLDQFVKIYSTGARAGNSYLNQITSFFKNHGLEITPESKIQDIIKLQ